MSISGSRILSPRDDTSPHAAAVFAEPWQARAFALMLKLRQHGHFTPVEWSAALGKALQDMEPGCKPPDVSIEHAVVSNYYQQWLTALESLVIAKGLTDRQALLQRKEAWAAAYRRTPHGKPVELG